MYIGGSRLLNEAAFLEYMKSFPGGGDAALQTYVQSSGRYTVYGRFGR